MTKKTLNPYEPQQLTKAFKNYDDEMRNRIVSLADLHKQIDDLKNENELLRKYIEQYSEGPECDKCCHVLSLKRFLKTNGNTSCWECE